MCKHWRNGIQRFLSGWCLVSDGGMVGVGGGEEDERDYLTLQWWINKALSISQSFTLQKGHTANPLWCLSPSPLYPSFSFKKKNVSTRANPLCLTEAVPCPRKHLQTGRAQGKSTLTYHNSWDFFLPLCLLPFLLHLHLIWGGCRGGRCQCDLDIQGWGGSRERGQTENRSWNKYYS